MGTMSHGNGSKKQKEAHVAQEVEDWGHPLIMIYVFYHAHDIIIHLTLLARDGSIHPLVFVPVSNFLVVCVQ